MHPAQYSATVEMQNEINSGLLTLFHRKPIPACYCREPVRMWVEPFGSWLQEKPKRTQVGFKSRTQGVALGFDGKVLDRLVMGLEELWIITIFLGHAEGAKPTAMVGTLGSTPISQPTIIILDFLFRRDESVPHPKAYSIPHSSHDQSYRSDPCNR